MYKITFIFSLLFLFLSPSYSETLPKCPGGNRVITTWINCNGSYTGIDGHKYSGDFDSNGNYKGYGILKSKNGVIYEGQFLKDKYHGKGKMTIPKPSLAYYEGDFFMGVWHGKGRLWVVDGSFEYDGELQNGEMTGYAKLSVNGKTVTGNWKNGSCNDSKTCEAVKAIDNQ